MSQGWQIARAPSAFMPPASASLPKQQWLARQTGKASASLLTTALHSAIMTSIQMAVPTRTLPNSTPLRSHQHFRQVPNCRPVENAFAVYLLSSSITDS